MYLHHYRVERFAERRSRIQRGDERGIESHDSPHPDTDGTRLRFDQLGLRASQLKLPYYRSISADEERYMYTLIMHMYTCVYMFICRYIL